VDLSFVPGSLQIQSGTTYEAKIAIDPKGERVTAISLALDYDPAVVSIIETKNEGFLPVTLKVSDDFQGRLNLIYGSTIDSQADKPGNVASIKFKANSNGPSRISLKGNTQVNVASQDGNALSEFPVLDLEPGKSEQDAEKQSYPGSLLDEKVVLPEADPFVREFQEGLEPKPSVGPVRVEPELSGRYVLQLGRDIFIEPVAALNEVLRDKAEEILKPE
jgi:hypothetical protein